jgi:hypothetical protein
VPCTMFTKSPVRIKHRQVSKYKKARTYSRYRDMNGPVARTGRFSKGCFETSTRSISI